MIKLVDKSPLRVSAFLERALSPLQAIIKIKFAALTALSNLGTSAQVKCKQILEKADEANQYIKKNKLRVAVVTGTALLGMTYVYIRSLQRTVEAFVYLKDHGATFCVYETNPKTKKLSKVLYEQNVQIVGLSAIKANLAQHSVVKLDLV